MAKMLHSRESKSSGFGTQTQHMLLGRKSRVIIMVPSGRILFWLHWTIFTLLPCVELSTEALSPNAFTFYLLKGVQRGGKIRLGKPRDG